MAKRKTTLVLVACFFMVCLAARSLCQIDGSSRTSKLPDLKGWQKTVTQRRLEREQKRKEVHERLTEWKKDFLWEKAAVGATEEQWRIIKAKLEEVRLLRGRATSGVGSFLVSSSTSGSGSAQSPTVPTWQWKNSWKDKAQDELTEAQRLARQLIDLVERKDVAQGTLKRTMDALRKARQQEPELQRQLAEARRELREGLTPRQEAALVLMRWL